MSVNQTLMAMAKQLGDGCNVRMICPRCNGGSTNETCMSLRRQGIVVWATCYRANCSLGSMRIVSDSEGIPRVSFVDAAVTRPPSSRFTGDTLPVPPKLQDYLWLQYGINVPERKEIALMHEVDVKIQMLEDGRLYIPMLNENGLKVGEEIKATHKQREENPGILKSRVYKDSAHNGLGWFKPVSDGGWPKPVIIVEDSLSAYKLAQHDKIGVCLYGSDMNHGQIATISRAVGNRSGAVYIALDADARRKMLRLVVRFAGVLEICPLLLHRDIKDMTQEDLLNFLRVTEV